MKKRRNFAAAILLSSIMAVSTCAGAVMTASAADPTYTITMSTTSGHTYSAYQIFKGDLNTTTTGSATTKTLSNIDWGTGVDSTALIAALKADTTYGSAFTTAIGEKTDKAAAAAVAKQLATYTNASDVKALAKIIGAKTTTAQSSLSGLAAGYYLIKDTTATLPTDDDNKTSDTYSSFMLEVVDNVSVTAKDSTVESHKTVTETDDTTPTTKAGQKVADYDIGDTVPYMLTFKLPSNYADYTNYPITFTDDMCAGLTWDGTATIYYGNYGADGATGTSISFTSVDGTSYSGGQKWTYTTADLKTISGLTAGSEVTVIYNATLNSSAAVNNVGNPNKYHVTFYSNPDVSKTPGSGDTTTPTPPTSDTPDDTTVVFTYELVFNKTDDQATPAPLEGADFTLAKNIGGQWKDVTSLHEGSGAVNPTKSDVNDNTTTFTFHGLDAGEYRLTETRTPEGYNTIEPIVFQVVSVKTESGDVATAVTGLNSTGLTMTSTFDAGNAKLTANIQNNKGAILPSTGGIGTTIFYVVGGTLTLGAVVLLITKKRMSVSDEK